MASNELDTLNEILLQLQTMAGSFAPPTSGPSGSTGGAGSSTKKPSDYGGPGLEAANKKLGLAASGLEKGFGMLRSGVQATWRSFGNIEKSFENLNIALIPLPLGLGALFAILQNTVDSYKGFIQVGQTFKGSMTTMAIIAADSGQSIESLLKGFKAGGVAAAQLGVAGFGKLSDQLQDNIQDFGAYGMTMDETNEFLGEQLEIQRMQGLQNKLRNFERVESFNDLQKASMALAEATGKSKDQLAKMSMKLQAMPTLLGYVAALGTGAKGASAGIQQFTTLMGILPDDIGSVMAEGLSASLNLGSAYFAKNLQDMLKLAPNMASGMDSIRDAIKDGGDVTGATIDMLTKVKDADADTLQMMNVHAELGDQGAQQFLRMHQQLQTIDFGDLREKIKAAKRFDPIALAFLNFQKNLANLFAIFRKVVLMFLGPTFKMLSELMGGADDAAEGLRGMEEWLLKNEDKIKTWGVKFSTALSDMIDWFDKFFTKDKMDELELWFSRLFSAISAWFSPKLVKRGHDSGGNKAEDADEESELSIMVSEFLKEFIKPVGKWIGEVLWAGFKEVLKLIGGGIKSLFGFEDEPSEDGGEETGGLFNDLNVGIAAVTAGLLLLAAPIGAIVALPLAALGALVGGVTLGGAAIAALAAQVGLTIYKTATGVQDAGEKLGIEEKDLVLRNKVAGGLAGFMDSFEVVTGALFDFTPWADWAESQGFENTTQMVDHAMKGPGLAYDLAVDKISEIADKTGAVFDTFDEKVESAYNVINLTASATVDEITRKSSETVDEITKTLDNSAKGYSLLFDYLGNVMTEGLDKANARAFGAPTREKAFADDDMMGQALDGWNKGNELTVNICKKQEESMRKLVILNQEIVEAAKMANSINAGTADTNQKQTKILKDTKSVMTDVMS